MPKPCAIMKHAKNTRGVLQKCHSLWVYVGAMGFRIYSYYAKINSLRNSMVCCQTLEHVHNSPNPAELAIPGELSQVLRYSPNTPGEAGFMPDATKHQETRTEWPGMRNNETFFADPLDKWPKICYNICIRSRGLILLLVSITGLGTETLEPSGSLKKSRRYICC